MTAPSAALQLGELEVQSALGQPLRASIAFALNPNEQLFNYCIALKPGTSADGLPMLSRATLSVSNGRILLKGSTPLREPMLALQVSVHCNYTANLTRSYTIMLDPSRPVSAVSVNTPSVTAPSVETNTAISTPTPERDPVPANVAAASVVVDTTPALLSSEYTVRVGDTLSGIATRIEDRPIALWPAVHAIFAANPDAFVDGNINHLIAGSRLTIPSLDNVTAPVVSSNNVVQEAVLEAPVAATGKAEVYSGYVPDQSSPPAEPSVATTDERVVPDRVNDPFVEEPFVNDPIPLAGTDEALLADIKPGDILVGDDATFVSPIDSSSKSSFDASIEPGESREIVNVAPLVADRPVPVVASTPTASSLAKTSDSWSWMFWLAGSGMALILGLLLFGRRIRGRFDDVAMVAAEDPIIQDDEDTARNETLSDLDFQVRDAQADGQDYTLDADLGEGTGLNDSAEIAVAQDFGFSTETDLDLELPEVIGQAALSDRTDIIPTQRINDPSILDEEILPSGESTYNMSMMVDATKQNIGDDVSTEKDLQAVPFDMVAATDGEKDFTMNEQVGLDALEQDYQDEFTATQAANLEIEKAAAKLALRLGEPPEDKTAEIPAADVAADSVDDKTAEMPEANDAAESTSEMTAQMPGGAQAENEEFSDLDETGFNDELTGQLPASEDDPTTEMEVETGHYKSQKSS